MDEMRSLAGRTAAFSLAVVVGSSVLACVPPPVGRASPPPTTPGPVTPSPVVVAPSPSGPTPPPSFVRPTPTALPTFLVYVVQSGDTLSSIARRFMTSPFSLAVWNRDTHPSLDPESEGYRPDLIQVGWALRVIPGVEVDEEVLLEPAPTPAPTTTPASPGASPTSGGGATRPPATGAATVVRHGPRTTKTVALTFDMGGRLDPALDIVAWLVDHDVPATIFPTGKTGT